MQHYLTVIEPMYIMYNIKADVNLGKPEGRGQRERTSALHKRLLKAEGEIQELKIEISNQRASWEMRFVELQRRQHDLRDQVCGSRGNHVLELNHLFFQ